MADHLIDETKEVAKNLSQWQKLGQLEQGFTIAWQSGYERVPVFVRGAEHGLNAPSLYALEELVQIGLIAKTGKGNYLILQNLHDAVADNFGEAIQPSHNQRHRVFISYRRDDTKWPTGHLHDHLSSRLGHQIFMDLKGIGFGEKFPEALEKALNECDVMIAMIGSDWLKPDQNGMHRIHNPNDWVRREIATALERDIHVIPVLVDGVRMPDDTILPDDLKKLTQRNAAPLSLDNFEADADRLANTINNILAKMETGAG